MRDRVTDDLRRHMRPEPAEPDRRDHRLPRAQSRADHADRRPAAVAHGAVAGRAQDDAARSHRRGQAGFGRAGFDPLHGARPCGARSSGSSRTRSPWASCAASSRRATPSSWTPRPTARSSRRLLVPGTPSGAYADEVLDGVDQIVRGAEAPPRPALIIAPLSAHRLAGVTSGARPVAHCSGHVVRRSASSVFHEARASVARSRPGNATLSSRSWYLPPPG